MAWFMIEFVTLGGVRLAGGNAERLAGLLTQPKRVALLAYLALARPRGFHSRDTVLALFWPELDGRHARWALNQAVRHLRQALGGDVVLRRGSDVGIDAARLACDAVELEASCAAGRWEDALGLYGGDLLAGVALGGAAELEHWLDGERERLRGLAAGAASAQSEQLLDIGEMPGASRFAREAVRLAPDDEARARRLIELLSAIGDRAGALRAYQDYAARLRSAGDVAPAPVGAWRLLHRPPPSFVFGRSIQVTADPSLEIQPALSPDGRLVAYAAGNAARMRIYIRTVTGERSMPLTDDSTAVEYQPRWSPDGNELLYLAHGGAWVAPALGGTGHSVAGPTATANVTSSAWSSDGREIAFTRGDSVLVAPARGGPSHFTLDDRESDVFVVDVARH